MIVKSIISVFTAGVILFSSAFTPVAKAGLVEDLANSYTQSSFAKFVMNGSFVTVGAGIGAYYGSPQIGAMVGEAVALGFNDVVEWYAAGHTDDEVYDAFAQHADSLKTDLGSATLINGGVRIYFPASSVDPVSTNNIDVDLSFSNDLTHFNANVITAGNPSNFTISYQASRVTVPFASYVTTGYNIDGKYESSSLGSFDKYLMKNTAVSAGQTIGYYTTTDRQNSYAKFFINFNGYGGPYAYIVRNCCVYVDCIPIAGFESLGIDVTTRPTSIIGDYGIIGDDGTIIHVEGNVIVDESTNTVYNPVTNTTNNYNEYEFDYSDRSYNLTLEDGSTIKVVYGDENITIEEGDTIYNIYYLIPNVPGGDDPGSGDDPGDIPGGEDWSWWRKAWQEFTDKLFGILGNGSTVNPDNVPSVPDDEESGDKGYTIIDLFVVLKDGTWAFITGIVGTAFDGFTSFVDAVASAGGFFTFFDEESQEGILFIPLEDGETIWD